MPLLTNLLLVLALPFYSSCFFVDLNKFASDLERKYHLGFLADYFKFPVYVNPHPNCALEDERCTEDTNCCRGMECLMTVDRQGIKYTCQGKVEDPTQEVRTMEAQEETEDTQEWQTSQESGEDSLLRDIYRTRLEELKEGERRLVNDQYNMIKELQKPLSFDEMRELQQIKEIQDYKRENELKALRQWRENNKAEEEKQRAMESKLKGIAVERVAKVLKEEEQQKLKMFKEIQDQMNRKSSWF